jgi:hypothetical protein
MLFTTLFWLSSLFLVVFASTFTDSHFVPRDTNPGNFSLLLDTSNSTGLQILAAKNPNCGATIGDCSKNGCQGVNLPRFQLAICTAGTYVGCACQYNCKSGLKCSDRQCQGINDPINGGGTCIAGRYAGCNCQSVCGKKNGPCNDKSCVGLNNVRGQPGFCTGGTFNGCFCKSICGNHDGSCTSNNCQGVNSVCTAGDFIGCPCGTACGNLEIGKCNANGCNGINSPSIGLGFCTSTKLKGCACTNICGAKNGLCKNCQGSAGVCRGGAFSGCYCL